jgi:hypothetical protein
MFVKVYTYHVIPEKEQDFVDVLAKAERIYAKYINKHSLILKNRNDSTKWMEIHTYQDEKAYTKSIEMINQHPDIQDLYTKFLNLIHPEEELTEEDFQVMTLRED